MRIVDERERTDRTAAVAVDGFGDRFELASRRAGSESGYLVRSTRIVVEALGDAFASPTRLDGHIASLAGIDSAVAADR